MKKVRIIRADALNFAVEVLETIKGKDDKPDREEWVTKGYYGHRLEWAAESALHLAMPMDEPVTPQMVKDAVASIVAETKGLFS